jgi:hypothetical protein
VKHIETHVGGINFKRSKEKFFAHKIIFLSAQNFCALRRQFFFCAQIIFPLYAYNFHAMPVTNKFRQWIEKSAGVRTEFVRHTPASFLGCKFFYLISLMVGRARNPPRLVLDWFLISES